MALSVIAFLAFVAAYQVAALASDAQDEIDYLSANRDQQFARYVHERELAFRAYVSKLVDSTMGSARSRHAEPDRLPPTGPAGRSQMEQATDSEHHRVGLAIAALDDVCQQARQLAAYINDPQHTYLVAESAHELNRLQESFTYVSIRLMGSQEILTAPDLSLLNARIDLATLADHLEYLEAVGRRATSLLNDWTRRVRLVRGADGVPTLTNMPRPAYLPVKLIIESRAEPAAAEIGTSEGAALKDRHAQLVIPGESSEAVVQSFNYPPFIPEAVPTREMVIRNRYSSQAQRYALLGAGIQFVAFCVERNLLVEALALALGLAASIGAIRRAIVRAQASA